MPTRPPAVTGVVVYAKDKERVAEFYRRTLTLDVEASEPGFTLLVGYGIEVSVVRIPPADAAQDDLTTPPTLRESTPLKPSFLVPSFETVRTEALACGGGLQPMTAAWSWRGSQHLDGHDPEGNIVQFRRSEAVPPDRGPQAPGSRAP